MTVGIKSVAWQWNDRLNLCSHAFLAANIHGPAENFDLLANARKPEMTIVRRGQIDANAVVFQQESCHRRAGFAGNAQR